MDQQAWLESIEPDVRRAIEAGQLPTRPGACRIEAQKETIHVLEGFVVGADHRLDASPRSHLNGMRLIGFVVTRGGEHALEPEWRPCARALLWSERGPVLTSPTFGFLAARPPASFDGQKRAARAVPPAPGSATRIDLACAL